MGVNWFRSAKTLSPGGTVMSQLPLIVRTRIDKVEVAEEDALESEYKGLVDVSYWLEQEDELVGSAEVRVYFRRTDIPLDVITATAPIQGSRILLKIAQHFHSMSQESIPDGLWDE
jgi:hypothetical protein